MCVCGKVEKINNTKFDEFIMKVNVEIIITFLRTLNL